MYKCTMMCAAYNEHAAIIVEKLTFEHDHDAGPGLSGVAN